MDEFGSHGVRLKEGNEGGKGIHLDDQQWIVDFML
jgi:hypothetical protein